VYKRGVLPSQRVRFASGTPGFHQIVRQRVDAYFEDRDLSRHADAKAVAKICFWLLSASGIYLGLISSTLPGLFVVVLGFSIAQVGFNVGHDAIHRATSKHSWVNEVLGWTFDLFGGSSYAWNLAHNVVHHTYTNMPGVDHDIDSEPWMHFHAHEKVARYYRWQHVFAFGYYALTMLAWTFVKDFTQLSARDPRTLKRTEFRGWVGMFIGKAAHLTVFIGLPMIFYAGPWWKVLIGYLLMQMMVGFALAIVFQLAHVVEGPAFPKADADGMLSHTWAEHQLHTTANFSTGGALATFLTGGLNHQIEHHLFPKISHTHYGALSEIVRQTAAEHGLPYHENRSFFSAVGSHIRTMRRFGMVPDERTALAGVTAR